MDKAELYLKADDIAERITTDTLLMNIMMGMSQDELEGILKYTGENTYATLTGNGFVSSVQAMSNKIRITTNSTSATKWTATVKVWYTKG